MSAPRPRGRESGLRFCCCSGWGASLAVSVAVNLVHPLPSRLISDATLRHEPWFPPGSVGAPLGC